MSEPSSDRSKRVLARQLCLFDEHGLTDAEARFADAYIVNRSATQAYMVANGRNTTNGTARKMGREWLMKDHIRAYIEQRQAELAVEAALSQEEVIAYLRTVALMGLGRLKVRRTLVHKDGTPHKQAAELYEPSLSAATSAALGLAKFLGVGDESRVTHRMSDEDLMAEFERLADALGMERKAA